MVRATSSHNALALVVVTHNSAAFLEEFFGTWAATMGACLPLDASSPEIIVADSGSTDETLTLLRTLTPQVNILPLENVGFGTAANRAIAATDAQWVLLCNPDLAFPRDFAETFLQPVLFPAASAPPFPPAAAVFAPRLLNRDGTPQPSVGEFPTVHRLLLDQYRPRPERKYVRQPPTTPAPIDWATGACLLVRREAFEAVGGFDGRFFLYVEEVDLQYRLSEAGYQTWFIPEATVRHLHPNANRAPRPEVQLYAARGLLRYFAKHGPTYRLQTYRTVASLCCRLPKAEAFAPRTAILGRSTGP